MPELPDVEGFRRELVRELPGRRIRRVDVRDAGVLRNTSARALARNLVDRTFEEPRRHGKWLILPTDGPVLLVHSGMTGRPYHTLGDDDTKHVRLVIALDHGEFRYADLRKLRGVWLLASEDDIGEVTGKQGPDALHLDLRSFRELLRGRRGRLKPTLMDQAVIAGLGNLLVDEILWRTRLSPSLPVSTLDDDDVKRLHEAMRAVLQTAVRHGRVPDLPRWLTGNREAPDPTCPRCGARLARGRIAGRTSVWCPHCQPAPG
ncbi:formamidopyrimidine-DNA glycosylase [Mycobacterium sp. IS-1590]|uniref:Fpg/Nei family DNA glycosylase n=1 Tax=Mycobacterium sp. IS-1590 TaxID=1772286 RepID=UPI000749152E|nr:DNA-formamidopyrimidine glycosylase family protein [Mycobacterium sp. IS-1590]KUI34107.1 formamidopyrimidine-DNA glycosylase [Mycobacterium sp. IS-1590]